MKPSFNSIAVLLLLVSSFSCKTSQMSLPKSFPAFYIEGHRGTRGLMPENTIASMTKAIEDGANVIEVDVYTSKDGKVIVTHDPSVNIEHTLGPDVKEFTKEEAKKYIFHQMNYEDIKKFDVGSKRNKAFPLQKEIPAYIPLLSELIDSVELFTQRNNLPAVIYNIELKSAVKYDVTYNAKPEELVDAVMEVVKSKNIGNRFYIQSFDFRPLKYSHVKYPKVVIGFLTDSKNSFEENIAELGFYPHIYSPHYNLITKELIDKAHQTNVKVVPWTVNTKEKMKEMTALGVDGIITDYANYLTEIRKQ